MNMNLQLLQTQKLVMTPELKQAIEMLQYSQLELNDFLQEELMTNPVLEMETPESAVEKKENATVEHDWKSIAVSLREHNEKQRVLTQSSKDDETVFESTIGDQDSLLDHLLVQLQFTDLKQNDLIIATYIIENIDENGYLDLTAEEVKVKFDVDIEVFNRLLNIIQGFEPIGVASRNLQECLKLQILADEKSHLLALAIVERHLKDLAENKLAIIAKALNARLEDVQRATDYIKTLEPKPGRLFTGNTEVRYIVPDVAVEKHRDGYQVIINDSTAPKLHISTFYQSVLETDDTSGASEYISKKLNSALRLIKSIEQRRNTIYRVVTAIVDEQKEFFDKGPLYLKTLTLKDIADMVGVHESTVSRAVSGKYLQCVHGLFEIKYFFQSGVSSEMGEGVSAETVKKIVKEQIDKEDQKKPLSDQYLADLLNELGIKISRRTVAKYRDEMLIPATSKRKRF
jgi:RNA polymerase sigma-54 factor